MRRLLGTFILPLLFSAPGLAQEAQRNQPNQQQQRDRMEMGRDDWRNQNLASRVETNLAGSMSLYGSDIDVKAENNAVTITGKVGSEQAKQRAERIALRTRGVRNVNNQLQVDQAFVQQRQNVNVTDDQLAKQVAQQIAQKLNAEVEEDWLFGWEVEAPQWEIEVEADGGMITLDGDAQSYQDMQEAVRAAYSVPGVRAVRNEMSLSWESRAYGPYGGYNYGYGYGYGYDYPYYTPLY